MIGWRPWVMWRVVCALVVMAGCWTDDTLVDGELTADQLAHVREQMRRPAAYAECTLPAGEHADSCDTAALLGQELFFDVRLSNQVDDQKVPIQGTGTVSCATCHDPNGYFIDTRHDNALSFGETTWTKRNSPTVLDVGLKYDLAPSKKVFVWSGMYASPGAVLDLAIHKAMSTWQTTVADAIEREPQYAQQYMAGIGPLGTVDAEFAGAVTALDAYMRRLNSTSPFDAYIGGDDSAISDSAKRGFGVFVGRGGCIECHSGAALSDFKLHNTGVAGPDDLGRGSASGDPLDDGTFVTASLRNVAMTGPYMHDGSLRSLHEVIAFYRQGGGPSPYPTKDPRMQPLDMTDADAQDLEDFLHTLTDTPVEVSLRSRPCVGACP